MLLDVLHQAVGVLAHAEEVGFLLRVLDRPAAVRAAAVYQLGLGPEGLAGLAVLALVAALVDVALIVQLFEDLLHLFLVHGVGGAHELVIGGVHQVPDALDLARDLIDVLLRGDARGLGLVLDLLAVLVRAGLEVHVIAGQALVARDRVGEHDLIGVADVRLRRGVGNRR